MRNLLLLFAFMPQQAWAHSIEHGSGFFSGFIHPWLGIDHLFAMLAIGVISSRYGGLRIWQMPVVFVVLMLLGTWLGERAVDYTPVAPGIALSLIMLGIVMVNFQPVALSFGLAASACFGLFHGYSHGIEMAAWGDPTSFRQGFICSAILIHILGVLLGMMPVHFSNYHRLLRASGLLFSITGLVFMFHA